MATVNLEVIVQRTHSGKNPNYCELRIGQIMNGQLVMKYADTLTEEQAQSTIAAFGLKIDATETAHGKNSTTFTYR